MYQPRILSAKEMQLGGSYPVYGANGIIGSYHDYNHTSPQLLITCRGATCGAVNISKPYSWINGNAMVVQPETSKVSIRYMEYICRGGIDLRAAITGAAQPQITRQSLEPIRFCFPPLTEQARIVAYLDTTFAQIDQALELANQTAAELQQLQTSLLEAALDGGDGWPKVRLSEVCRIVNGGTPKSKVEAYWGGDIQWLTPKDMGQLNGHLVSRTERQISQLGLQESAAKLIEAHSIILSCRAPIGHLAINQVPMSFNQGCKGLVPNAAIEVAYLYYFLFAAKPMLNALGTGTTFKEISAKTLAQVELRLPPIAEQQRIVAKLDGAFAQLHTAAAALAQVQDNYHALKRALMARALQPDA